MVEIKNKNDTYTKFENAKKGAVAGIHKLLKDVIEYRHKNESDYLGNKKTIFKFNVKYQNFIKTEGLFHPDILEEVNFLIENIINQDLELISQNKEQIKKWLDEFIKKLINELEKRKKSLEKLKDKKQRDRLSQLNFVVNIDTIVDLIKYLEKIKEILNNFIDKCFSFEKEQKKEKKQKKIRNKVADFLEDELGTNIFTPLIKKGPKGIIQQVKDWKKDFDQKDSKEKRNYIGGKVLSSLGVGLGSPLLMLVGNKISEKANKYEEQRKNKNIFLKKLNSKLEYQQKNIAKKETTHNKLKENNFNRNFEMFQNKKTIKAEPQNDLNLKENIKDSKIENLNEKNKEFIKLDDSNKIKNNSQKNFLAQKKSSLETLDNLNKKISFQDNSKEFKLTNKNLFEINENIKQLLKIEREKLNYEIERDNDENLKRKTVLKQDNSKNLLHNNNKFQDQNPKVEKDNNIMNLLDMGLDFLSLIPGGGFIKIFKSLGKLLDFKKIFNFKELFKFFPKNLFGKIKGNPLASSTSFSSPNLGSAGTSSKFFNVFSKTGPLLNVFEKTGPFLNVFEKTGPLLSKFLPMLTRLGSLLTNPVSLAIGTGLTAYQTTKTLIKNTSIGKGAIGEKIYDWLHPEVGSVSMAAESGAGNISLEKRAGTISSGKGDHGGKSYGIYQFSSKTGGLNSFLKDNPEYAAKLGTPGTAEFDANWKKLSSDKGFQQAQLKTGRKLYLNPVIDPASKIGLNTKSRAIQEMLMSTSVQYGQGGAVKLLNEVAKANPNFKNMSAEEQINAIQDYKAKTTHIWFKNSDKRTQEHVKLRHDKDERKRLLAVLKAEKEGKLPATEYKKESEVASNISQKNPVENIKKESQSKIDSKHAGLEKNNKNETPKSEQPTQVVNNNITNINNSSQSGGNVVLATLDQSWIMQRARTY